MLRHAGLVLAERHGQEIFYELNTSVFQDLVQHLMELVKPPARARLPKPRRQRPRQQEA